MRTEPCAWAVQNADGYWVGIWKDKQTAELVLSKGLASNKERLAPLFSGDDLARLTEENAQLRKAVERYEWLCADLDAEQRARRSHILNRMSVMGKGAIDAAIDAARRDHET